MIQEIQYTGIALNTPDNLSPDGSLDYCVNLINENASLSPALPPKVIGQIPPGYDAGIMHKPSGQCYLVIYNSTPTTQYGTKFAYIEFDPSGIIASANVIDLITIPTEESILSVRPFGNMIILSTSLRFYYFLYKPETGYVFLGNNIPNILLNFDLDDSHREKSFDLGITATDTEKEIYDEGTLLGTQTEQLSLSRHEWVNLYGGGGSVQYSLWYSKPLVLKGISIQANTKYRVSNPIYGMTGGDSRLSDTGYVNIQLSDGSLITLAQEGSRKKEFIEFTVAESYEVVTLAVFAISSLLSGYRCSMATIPIYLQTLQTTVTEASLPLSKESFTALIAAANKFVADAHKDGFFLYPFFVRYAIRLFDESVVNVSVPTLFKPNGYSCVPEIALTTNSANAILRANASKLVYSAITPANLEDWSDIISSVEIYVSSPIYTYNQGAEFDDTTACDLLGDPSKIAPKSIEDVYEEIRDCSIFRRIASIPFGDLQSGANEATVLPLESETILSYLNSCEALSTESAQHGNITGRFIDYNNRIHLFDARTSLPKPPSIDFKVVDTADRPVFYWIEAQTPNGMRRSEIIRTKGYPQAAAIDWFFYPGTYNYNLKIAQCVARTIDNTNGILIRFFDIQLKHHDFLPGSYVQSVNLYNNVNDSTKFYPFPSDFSDSNDLEAAADSIPVSLLTIVPDTPVSSANKVYTSEVNNPFVFSPNQTNSLGNTQILALASATKALSSGQFGQFPLYAFTNEGIWALEMTQTGTIASTHPVTRDVCSAINSITPIDDAVLFFTARGLMVLQGSSAICISDRLKTLNPFDLTKLPAIDKLPERFRNLLRPHVPFTDFINNSALLYDYTHQRIICYPKDNNTLNVSFVYSFASRTWSMMQANIKNVFNCYPNAVAIDANNNLLDYSCEDSSQTSQSLLLSRPMQLSAPEALKSISTVILRGVFRKGAVMCALYGSRNLRNWHLIWSSKNHYLRGFSGTPYKYFRILTIADLDSQESISGASIVYSLKETNQLR